MTSLSQLRGTALQFIKANSSSILSSAASVGTLGTAYLAAKASFKAANVIRDHEEQHAPSAFPRQRTWDRTKLVWKLYVPSAISAASTVGCIAGAHRVGVKKAVAAQAALAVTERAYSQYRDKVVEELGTRKDQAIRDKVVTEQVEAKPPPSPDVLVAGTGEVLCCELFTMRYFTCDVEKLRQAVNTLNAALLVEDQQTFDDFYYLVGLRPTKVSSQLGWRSDRLLELIFSTTLTDDGRRPCITFEYNYYKTL
jgi:hypothetical protein